MGWIFLCYNLRYMQKHFRSIAQIVFGAFLLFALVAIFTPAQSVHATCKCVSSGSASLSSTQGIWQTYEDGGASCDTAGQFREGASCNPLAESYINVWFCVPTLGDLIGNLIRIIFFIAGLLAIFMLLMGGFEWVSSGGDDKKLSSARGKIVNAVIGLVVMVAVMTLVVLIEQVIFGGKMCLGISCPLDVGKLAIIENNSPGGRASCFGPASRSAALAPASTATAGARVAPLGTGSAFLTPIKKSLPIIVTATPSALSGTAKPAPPIKVSPGTQVIILPYGTVSGSPTPSPAVVLPGSGGGGGTGVPRPTIPPLE